MGMTDTFGSNITHLDWYEQFIKDGPSRDAVYLFRKFTLPILFVFGEIGSFLSAIVFLGPKFRKTSCNLYLAARSMSDICFILSLFVAWLDFIQHSIFNRNGVCQILLFVSSVSSFLSVWFVLFITFENYIRLCHPAKVALFCNTLIAKYVIGIGMILSAILYNFPLWGIKVQNIYGKKLCMTIPEYANYEKWSILLDTVITLIAPVVTIFILLFLTFLESVKASKRLYRYRRPSGLDDVQLKRRHGSYRNVTRLLTAVSITFVILHTPNHVIRLKVVIENLTGSKVMATKMERTLQHIFIIMYYLNFMVNYIVYFICGKRFRKKIVEIFKTPCLRIFKTARHEDCENI